MPIQILKNSLSQLAADLIKLHQTQFVHKTFTIQCSDLPTPREEDNIYHYGIYKTLFDDLDINVKSPYVYWFEIKEGLECEDIRSHIKVYTEGLRDELARKLHHDDRNFYSVPAMTGTIKDVKSKILYVGKVKSNLKGRLVPHFGYYHRSPNTQGLQLARWAKNENLHLDFHYIKLPKELTELTSYLEFKLAKELKPILGRHSG